MINHRRFLLLLIIPTLLITVLILTDWWPILRGPAPETSEWYWPYQLRPFPQWLPTLLTASLLWLGASWWVNQNHYTKIGLFSLTIGVIALQLSLIYADNATLTSELINRTLSNLASGYFEPAAEIDDLHTTLRQYPHLMPTFASEHAQTHPPGLIIANWLTIQLMAKFPTLATAVAPNAWQARCTDLWLLNRPTNVAAALVIWSLLPLLAAAFTVWPAYSLAKRTLTDEKNARLATTLTATIPALLLFAPKSVQLYPPLTLLIFLTALIAHQTQKTGWLIPSGFLLGFSTFLSLGNAALVLPLTLFLIALSRPLPLLLKQLATLAIAAATPWLLYWLGWGVPPWQIAQTGLSQHYNLVTLHRNYSWWLGYNWVDILVFAGWPLLLGFLIAIGVALRRNTRRHWRPLDLITLTTAVLLILLNLSGSARGEVGRIWLFLFPLLALTATPILSKRAPVPLILILQLMLTISIGTAWQPVRAVIVIAERPLMTPPTDPIQPLNTPFREANTIPFALTGYTLSQTDTTLDLILIWEAKQAAKRPYTTFVQLLNSQGQLMTQQDNWPVNGQWPPTCWQRGNQIIDPYHLQLPDNLPPGQYQLITGLYDAQSGHRLLTTSGNDHQPVTTITLP